MRSVIHGDVDNQGLLQAGGPGLVDKAVDEETRGRWAGMHCPFCRHTDSRVVDSRTADDGQSIRRRRLCPACGRRFSTHETTSLTVVKRSGVAEPFSRDKVMSGVAKACQGRPVTRDQLALLAQAVEDEIRSGGVAEIAAHDVGVAVLGPLRLLDEVAYLRFASVYQCFETLEDFEASIALLRAERHAGPQADTPQTDTVGVGSP